MNAMFHIGVLLVNETHAQVLATGHYHTCISHSSNQASFVSICLTSPRRKIVTTSAISKRNRLHPNALATRATIRKKNLTWTKKLSDQLNLAHVARKNETEETKTNKRQRPLWLCPGPRCENLKRSPDSRAGFGDDRRGQNRLKMDCVRRHTPSNECIRSVLEIIHLSALPERSHRFSSICSMMHL